MGCSSRLWSWSRGDRSCALVTWGQVMWAGHAVERSCALVMWGQVMLGWSRGDRTCELVTCWIDHEHSQATSSRNREGGSSRLDRPSYVSRQCENVAMRARTLGVCCIMGTTLGGFCCRGGPGFGLRTGRETRLGLESWSRGVCHNPYIYMWCLVVSGDWCVLYSVRLLLLSEGVSVWTSLVSNRGCALRRARER